VPGRSLMSKFYRETCYAARDCTVTNEADAYPAPIYPRGNQKQRPYFCSRYFAKVRRLLGGGGEREQVDHRLGNN